MANKNKKGKGTGKPQPKRTKATKDRIQQAAEAGKQQRIAESTGKVDLRVGNTFWQFRTKHGRDKIFANAALMWEESLKYFKWCDDNPDKRAELVKYEGSASEEEVSLKRLYTLIDLCHYLGVSRTFFIDFKSRLPASEKDFLEVIGMIEEVIESQQVRGAAVGHFNANIISRLQGLVDKKDVTTKGLPIQAPAPIVHNVGPKLANSETDIDSPTKKE